MSTTPPPDLSQLRLRRDEPGPRERRGGGSLLLWLVLILLAAGLGAWYFLTPRAMQVRVTIASATGGGGATVQGISANGYVVARTKASVSAKIPGRMEYLGVHEGSEVKKDEVIARIEAHDYEAALGAARATVAEVEAQLAQARRDLERARTLRKEQLISDADLENTSTRVDVLSAQLEAARAQRQLAAVNLENTRVRAPFDGT